MCVTWMHLYNCNHNRKHLHRCYSDLLQRPGCIQYPCDDLITRMSCSTCLQKELQMIKKQLKGSERQAVRRSCDQDLEEINRLESVVQNWREKVAGTIPLSKDHRIRRLLGHSAQDPGLVTTLEWKVGWLEIVRIEVDKRRNSTSTDSTLLSLSTDSESLSSTSNDDVKELWAGLRLVEKFGAVKDWLKDEIEEDTRLNTES